MLDFEPPERVLPKNRLKRGRRSGRLPHVIPMEISRKVHTPASTWVTRHGSQKM